MYQETGFPTGFGLDPTLIACPPSGPRAAATPKGASSLFVPTALSLVDQTAFPPIQRRAAPLDDLPERPPAEDLPSVFVTAGWIGVVLAAAGYFLGYR